MTTTTAHLVGRVLADLGVGHAFGVVGSGNFDVTNSLVAGGVPFLAARHEGGAATMADAYSRLADLPGVLSVHQGCGLTNAMTGIAEAAKSRTPMLVLAADTASAAVNSNFRIDQDALVSSVGAVSHRVHSSASAVEDVVRAYRAAVQGRRTVVLNLPLDVQATAAPDGARAVVPPGAVTASAPVRPGVAAVVELAELLQRAERPVFVAGRGGRTAGPEIAALAERVGALVATSAVANGLFHDELFNLGISGGFSSPLVAELIAGADLVVGWGCALNMWTMRHGSLIGRGATVVQVDDDESALGAHRPVDLGVLGDCRATAADTLALLDAGTDAGTDADTDAGTDAGAELGVRNRVAYRTLEVADRLARGRWWNDTATPDGSTADRIDPRVLAASLDAVLPRERVVAIDSGNFMGYPSAYLRVPDERGFVFTQAFQSIGLGLAGGIGASLAQPDRIAVVGTGDGGLLMAAAELETAVRSGRPMVVAVWNDAAYGAEVHHFGSEADLRTVTFPDTDFAALAQGYGAAGVTVRTRGDVDQVADWAKDPQGVLVVDAKVADIGGSWWLAEAFKGH